MHLRGLSGFLRGQDRYTPTMQIPYASNDVASRYRAEDEIRENQMRHADDDREQIQQQNDMLEYYLSKNRSASRLSIASPSTQSNLCCAGLQMMN